MLQREAAGQERRIDHTTLRRYAVALGAAWTIIVAASLAWNLVGERNQVLDLAEHEALVTFNKDQAFRHWATKHGGLYVPATEKTPPNPYLAHLPERDIVLPSGRKLTLMNPAYALRQLMADFQTEYGVRGHITSLKPLNPVNAPDAWERQSLASFGRGAVEASEFTALDGKTFLRIMRPMITRQGCLKCHAPQGYRVGDILGGVSVTLPMESYLAGLRGVHRKMTATHGLIWLIGAIGIGIAYQRGKGNIAKLARADANIALLKFALDNVREEAYLIDEAAGFRYVNEGACRALGYDRDELRRLGVADVDPDFPADRWREHWRELKARGALTFEGRHRAKDGSLFPVEINASYFEYAGSGYNLALARDITERKRAAQEKEKLERQLRQAQKMEAMGALAGGVAHDFNNVLTAIMGYANIVKMKMHAADPQRAHVDGILSSAERAAHLTQNLLAFSRKQVLDPKPTNLNDVVRNVESLLRRLIGEDIDLAVQTVERPLIVMADAGQIEQVLMNLATNARDAMPRGGLLTIATQEVDLDEGFMRAHPFGPPGRYAHITVSDTGTGMDAGTRERIFEPFFTTKEFGKGTGLGMSIVYGIVKQHAGSISVYSEPGRGTTFKIYLPLTADPPAATGAAASVVEPRGGTETILVAEDDRTVREMLRLVLQDYGYRVIEAADGQEAVDLFRERGDGVDLLLLDVIMPKKNGREVAQAVRDLRPHMRLVYMSGYTADIIRKEGIAEEGIPFLPKPVNPTELLQTVRQTLDRKA